MTLLLNNTVDLFQPPILRVEIILDINALILQFTIEGKGCLALLVQFVQGRLVVAIVAVPELVPLLLVGIHPGQLFFSLTLCFRTGCFLGQPGGAPCQGVRDFFADSFFLDRRTNHRGLIRIASMDQGVEVVVGLIDPTLIVV